jgi:D-sedoheptulose 7-phosphate isomerase
MQNNLQFNEYVTELFTTLESISIESLEGMVSALAQIRDAGGTLWIAGNGGSASTASHFVTDFSKGVSENGKQPLRTIAISEMTALVTATANDIDFEHSYSLPIDLYGSNSDAILIISVSGLSPNLLEAVKSARHKGMKVFSIVGIRGRELSDTSDASILLNSDDYQQVENAQLALGHWFLKCLK